MGRKNKKVNGIVNKDDRVWVRWHETELETIPEIKKVPIYLRGTWANESEDSIVSVSP